LLFSSKPNILPSQNGILPEYISGDTFGCQGICSALSLKEFAIMTHPSNASQMPQVNLTSLLTKSAQRVFACLLMEFMVISLMIHVHEQVNRH
jgi:hypothetical protein